MLVLIELLIQVIQHQYLILISVLDVNILQEQCDINLVLGLLIPMPPRSIK